jgi:hypothetical protein
VVVVVVAVVSVVELAVVDSAGVVVVITDGVVIADPLDLLVLLEAMLFDEAAGTPIRTAVDVLGELSEG